jgi:uncharacterized protein YjbJ (UPF0337 family)
MNEDRIEGTVRNVAGTGKRVAGDLTGDKGLQAEGLVDQVTGQVQDQLGKAKDRLGSVADTAQHLGSRVYDVGSKATHYVSENARGAPLITLAVGIAIGYAIGAMVHRASEPPPPSYRFWR